MLGIPTLACQPTQCWTSSSTVYRTIIQFHTKLITWNGRIWKWNQIVYIHSHGRMVSDLSCVWCNVALSSKGPWIKPHWICQALLSKLTYAQLLLYIRAAKHLLRSWVEKGYCHTVPCWKVFPMLKLQKIPTYLPTNLPTYLLISSHGDIWFGSDNNTNFAVLYNLYLNVETMWHVICI